ncbi:hypothetical protein [Aeoliella sp.]|uniref:hypothetical protein n=1 Tax=Aeoliella sp. TaxID=2795800 RepID=UPI003CCC2B04
MSDSWWSSIEGEQLAQGDLLADCSVPIVVDPTPSAGEDEAKEVEVVSQRLIIVTQSCDLENGKVQFVALCPIHTLDEFAEANAHYKSPKNWEGVRKGQKASLHMLASPEAPEDNTKSLVVDFGHILSLPIEYLTAHAATLGGRSRLQPPFLEHFSQAFARFFMRVGLPSSIAPFK